MSLDANAIVSEGTKSVKLGCLLRSEVMPVISVENKDQTYKVYWLPELDVTNKEIEKYVIAMCEFVTVKS